MSKSIPIINKSNEITKETTMPALFNMPVRGELILHTFKNLRMNSRQPYAVKKYAGLRHSAKSWGTGRAVARVPRVRASGTRRSGQGAEANFCRGGHMAFPTTVNRRWARKTNKKTRQLVNKMGIAATANLELVKARGHVVDGLQNIPIVVDNSIEKIEKTKSAVEFLHAIGLKDELQKVADSRTIRNGKHKEKSGILIVHDSSIEDFRAFRSIRGVDVASYENLSILDTCPGGIAGRLVIWTESVFEKLQSVEINYEEVKEFDFDTVFYSEEVMAHLDKDDYQYERNIGFDYNRSQYGKVKSKDN